MHIFHFKCIFSIVQPLPGINCSQVLAYTGAGDGRFSVPVSCSTEEDGKYFSNSLPKRRNQQKRGRVYPFYVSLKFYHFSLNDMQWVHTQEVFLCRQGRTWGGTGVRPPPSANFRILGSPSQVLKRKNSDIQIQISD